MKKFGLYIFTPIISFFSGYYFYALSINFLLGGSIDGDVDAVLFWGGQAYFLCGVPFYFLIIYYIDKTFSRYKILLYPLGCVIGFLIPVLAIMMTWGYEGLFSPDIVSFYYFFIGAGLIFGLFNWGFKRVLD
ncbi:hypothetical protein LG329_01010 [Virgibacillus necropolis]|uniref:hypothetical protein n=1 Tax=Virgibacillus necropolis TaxID=163877 RepID=UPI00384EB411